MRDVLCLLICVVSLLACACSRERKQWPVSEGVHLRVAEQGPCGHCKAVQHTLGDSPPVRVLLGDTLIRPGDIESAEKHVADDVVVYLVFRASAQQRILDETGRHVGDSVVLVDGERIVMQLKLSERMSSGAAFPFDSERDADAFLKEIVTDRDRHIVDAGVD